LHYEDQAVNFAYASNRFVVWYLVF